MDGEGERSDMSLYSGGVDSEFLKAVNGSDLKKAIDDFDNERERILRRRERLQELHLVRRSINGCWILNCWTLIAGSNTGFPRR